MLVVRAQHTDVLTSNLVQKSVTACICDTQLHIGVCVTYISREGVQGEAALALSLAISTKQPNCRFPGQLAGTFL